MSLPWQGGEVTIAYNGEVYNAPELRRELEGRGFSFETACDTEVVLAAYLAWGPGCAEKLNGIFAFAVDDPLEQRTVLCRDRFGVKPLFYTLREGRLVFASEIKGLLEFPGVEPVVGPDGLRELCRRSRMVAVDFEGRRYDTGNLCGFLEATIDFALDHPATGAWLKGFLKEKAETLRQER